MLVESIRMPLEGLRRCPPACNTLSEDVSRASGVVGGALLCSPDTTDRLADLRVPSGRMELFSPLIVAGLGRWVKQAVQALSASFGAY